MDGVGRKGRDTFIKCVFGCRFLERMEWPTLEGKTPPRHRA